MDYVYPLHVAVILAISYLIFFVWTSESTWRSAGRTCLALMVMVIATPRPARFGHGVLFDVGPIAPPSRVLGPDLEGVHDTRFKPHDDFFRNVRLFENPLPLFVRCGRVDGSTADLTERARRQPKALPRDCHFADGASSGLTVRDFDGRTNAWRRSGFGGGRGGVWKKIVASCMVGGGRHMSGWGFITIVSLNG